MNRVIIVLMLLITSCVFADYSLTIQCPTHKLMATLTHATYNHHQKRVCKYRCDYYENGTHLRHFIYGECEN